MLLSGSKNLKFTLFYDIEPEQYHILTFAVEVL